MSESERSPAPARFSGCTVLIVEDETMVSFLLEDMLNDLGCAGVWHACSVREALEVLQDRRPDAAVLDINLAGEFAYAIAEQLEAARVPFIFATGYGETGIRDRWRLRPVIQKPFQIEALAAALESVLDKHSGEAAPTPVRLANSPCPGGEGEV
jgi:DNA-binding response OmpR family regulator